MKKPVKTTVTKSLLIKLVGKAMITCKDKIYARSAVTYAAQNVSNTLILSKKASNYSLHEIQMP
jgi:hypothetical protein